MKATLHMVNGEKIELSEELSQQIYSVVQTNSQSLHSTMIHEWNYSIAMWNVVKIDWEH